MIIASRPTERALHPQRPSSTKAFDQVLPLYQRDAAWVRDRFNANIVNNAGMGLGALAIAGDSGDAGMRTVYD